LSWAIIMDTEDFERLNLLSEKALNDTLTPNELVEFNELYADCGSLTELQLFGGFYPPHFKT